MFPYQDPFMITDGYYSATYRRATSIQYHGHSIQQLVALMGE